MSIPRFPTRSHSVSGNARKRRNSVSRWERRDQSHEAKATGNRIEDASPYSFMSTRQFPWQVRSHSESGNESKKHECPEDKARAPSEPKHRDEQAMDEWCVKPSRSSWANRIPVPSTTAKNGKESECWNQQNQKRLCIHNV